MRPIIPTRRIPCNTSQGGDGFRKGFRRQAVADHNQLVFRQAGLQQIDPRPRGNCTPLGHTSETSLAERGIAAAVSRSPS